MKSVLSDDVPSSEVGCGVRGKLLISVFFCVQLMKTFFASSFMALSSSVLAE